MKLAKLLISDISVNDGQIDGIQSNPRYIKNDDFERLKKSLMDDPEMLQLREPVVYDNNGEYVVIMGNMRIRALKSVGVKNVVCKVLPQDTPLEKIKAFAIKDNLNYGSWDWDVIANGFDVEELEDWGLDVKDMSDDPDTTIVEFGKACNLTIKCDDIDQLKSLQALLDITEREISYDDFIIRTEL